MLKASVIAGQLFAAAVTVLGLAACQPRPLPTGPPTVTPQNTPTATSVLPLNPSSPQALAACGLDIQNAALRPALIPDWKTLGISTCYDLTFDLTGGGPGYSGTARITFTNPGNLPLTDLVLRTYPDAPVLYGGKLTITRASVKNKEVSTEPFLVDKTAVRLILPSLLTAGETVQLALTFTGSLPVDFGSKQIYGTFNYNSQGPVLLMANAYPLLAPLENGVWRADPVQTEGDAVISSIALYRVTVQLPADWKLVSSGRTINSETRGAVQTITIAGGPLREFMLAASPQFEVKQSTWQDMQINAWGMTDSAPGTGDVLQTASDALDLYSKTFGALPYNELDIIAAPLNNASGVEYPGLILLEQSLYTSDQTPRRLPQVTAHEIAHQWWYAVVGSDVLLHPWQDEALTTFSAQLYAAAFDSSYYQGTLTEFRRQVTRLEGEIGVQPLDQSVEALTKHQGEYSIIAYLKGDLFFEAVRGEIGAKAMDTALQTYYHDYIFQIAAPRDLLGRFESACGCDLTTLYREWGVIP